MLREELKIKDLIINTLNYKKNKKKQSQSQLNPFHHGIIHLVLSSSEHYAYVLNV